MSNLNLMDTALLRMESKRTPMHVGAMLTFKLPPGSPPDFCQQLVREMRTKPFMPYPFHCRLARGRFKRLRPSWVEAEVDMDYHLRCSALPFPGGERELGVLVARLHSHPLDLSRPLWECHIIEGLENGRFALYFKAHHCAIDGMGAMRMINDWLSSDPADARGMGPWVVAAKPERPAEPPLSLGARVKKPMAGVAGQAKALQELVSGLNRMAKGEDSFARMTLDVPRSLFNMPISQQRRLGTQILAVSRLKAVAKAAGGGAKLNDALLAVLGGAIRRYLIEQGALPEKTLVASVPIGLERSDGTPGSIATGFVAPLGTNLDDPLERIQWIRRVTTRAKAELQDLSRDAQLQFALLGLAPLLLGQITGTLPKLPPLFNCVVSNVVLSNKPLYLMGAELEAVYPVSFLFDGYALNVTLVGYKDSVAVGFLGCRSAIPSLQRLAVYTTDALAELERAVGIVPPQ
ncbi:wax ester/triacylglycerol synthase family O-acyltransferase [Solimonas sp. K1W22B-7]|uniref:wax ester/triacylglycerol synthase family O-acyltransferase n=1 Tax=Solimonas sp. K1W22B-7 TaxID=2303331 RepID=UPI000E3314BA|nr:wax ester/triacylglycerol synthase family O-acyltransferase [Solimonas sp. K1W22B-7]AXQ31366.1 wax ester/triacylglycerol synthase family O-acyltransferase [Solimonas sp. K1W22B-7]